MEINCSKEIKNITVPHSTGCCLSSPSPGSFPNTEVHTMNAESEKPEGRAPCRNHRREHTRRKSFLQDLNWKALLLGKQPHSTKSEPRKNGLARALLINPTVIQRSSNLQLNCSQPQKGKEKKETVGEHFLTTPSSAL